MRLSLYKSVAKFIEKLGYVYIKIRQSLFESVVKFP